MLLGKNDFNLSFKIIMKKNIDQFHVFCECLKKNIKILNMIILIKTHSSIKYIFSKCKSKAMCSDDE